MTVNEIRNYLGSLCSHIVFDYNGKSCGVDPLSVHHFEMWYGDSMVQVSSIEEVMKMKLFGGKNLEEIGEEIEV